MGTHIFGQLDEEGREIPDPTPIVIYINNRPVTDYDRIREMIAVQMSLSAANAGMETIEEANDFEVDDDLFPVAPHEYTEETEAADREALAAEETRRKKSAAAAAERKRRKADAEDAKPPSGTPDGGAGSEGGTPSPDRDSDR